MPPKTNSRSWQPSTTIDRVFWNIYLKKTWLTIFFIWFIQMFCYERMLHCSQVCASWTWRNIWKEGTSGNWHWIHASGEPGISYERYRTEQHKNLSSPTNIVSYISLDLFRGQKTYNCALPWDCISGCSLVTEVLNLLRPPRLWFVWNDIGLLKLFA